MATNDDKTPEQQHEEMIARIGPGPTFTHRLKGRSFTRKIGCWNCISWNCEEMARARWIQQMASDLRKYLEAGDSVEAAEKKIAYYSARFGPPKTGICLKGKGGADFVSAKYLCRHWNGRINPRDYPGEKLDATPQELRAKLGDKDIEDE